MKWHVDYNVVVLLMMELNSQTKLGNLVYNSDLQYSIDLQGAAKANLLHKNIIISKLVAEIKNFYNIEVQNLDHCTIL